MNPLLRLSAGFTSVLYFSRPEITAAADGEKDGTVPSRVLTHPSWKAPNLIWSQHQPLNFISILYGVRERMAGSESCWCWMNVTLRLAALLTSRREKLCWLLSEWRKKNNFSEWHVRPCSTLSHCRGLCGWSRAADSFKPGLPALKPDEAPLLLLLLVSCPAGRSPRFWTNRSGRNSFKVLSRDWRYILSLKVINLPVDRTETKSPNWSSDPIAGRNSTFYFFVLKLYIH